LGVRKRGQKELLTKEVRNRVQKLDGRREKTDMGKASDNGAEGGR